MKAIKIAHEEPPQIAYLMAYPVLLLCLPPYDWQHFAGAGALWGLTMVGIMARWKSVFRVGFVVTVNIMYSAAHELLNASAEAIQSVGDAARLILAIGALVCLQTTTVLEWFEFRFPSYSKGTYWLICTAFALGFVRGHINLIWAIYCGFTASQ